MIRINGLAVLLNLTETQTRALNSYFNSEAFIEDLRASYGNPNLIFALNAVSTEEFSANPIIPPMEGAGMKIYNRGVLVLMVVSFVSSIIATGIMFF